MGVYRPSTGEIFYSKDNQDYSGSNTETISTGITGGIIYGYGTKYFRDTNARKVERFSIATKESGYHLIKNCTFEGVCVTAV